MTYENAIEWLEKNVPLDNYDEFSDWYEACEEKLNTPNLFESAEFNKMLEDLWLGQYGSFSKTPTPVDTIEQKTRVFESSTIPEPKEKEIPVILPEKEISKPVIVVPPNIPEQKKKSFLDKVKGIFNRLRRKK
jgi:hypothetical protein